MFGKVLCLLRRRSCFVGKMEVDARMCYENTGYWTGNMAAERFSSSGHSGYCRKKKIPRAANALFLLVHPKINDF